MKRHPPKSHFFLVYFFLILDLLRFAMDVATAALADAMHTAAVNGNIQEVQNVLAQVSEMQLSVASDTLIRSTAMLAAVRTGRAELVEFLLRCKVCPNTPDDEGQTPLIIAAAEDHLQIVNLLLQFDCSVNTPGMGGGTALFQAAYYGSDRALVALLAAPGCDISFANEEGETPLHAAVKRGHGITVSILLEAGCARDAVDHDGDNAVHIAVIERRGDIVNILLAAGCDPTITNLNNRCAFTTALNDTHNDDIVYLMAVHNNLT